MGLERKEGPGGRTAKQFLANVQTAEHRWAGAVLMTMGLLILQCFRAGVGIIPKISSTIVGAAGEYHVLSQLLRRGWVAALAPDGAPNMDILVTDKDNNKLCAIQVKTRRDIGSDKGWHMKPKHGGMTAADLFYVFVDVGSKPSDPTTCFIMPSQTVADCIRECHHVWLVTPGRGGKSHRDSNVRRLMPDYASIRPVTPENIAIIDNYRAGWLEPFRENWGILGLPEATSF